MIFFDSMQEESETRILKFLQICFVHPHFPENVYVKFETNCGIEVFEICEV